MQRYALIIWATIRNRGDAYHCFRKGMKPFPALAPVPLGGIITYISMHRSYIYPVQVRASCPPSQLRFFCFFSCPLLVGRG